MSTSVCPGAEAGDGGRVICGRRLFVAVVRTGEVEIVKLSAVDITGMTGEHEGERGVSWDKMDWGPSGLI